MENKYKVRLNSADKVEELLQEVYDQACRHFVEIQNEMNKLTNNVNLADETIGMDEKAKYAKAMHDYMADKHRAITTKFEIAKFMGDLIKHHGDIDSAIEEQQTSKKTNLDWGSLRASMTKAVTETEKQTYELKK